MVRQNSGVEQRCLSWQRLAHRAEVADHGDVLPSPTSRSRSPLLGALALAAAVLTASCSAVGPAGEDPGATSPSGAKTERLPPVSEPQKVSPATTTPTGQVVDLGGHRPEGVVFDPATSTLVAALRDPAQLALVGPDLSVRTVDSPGAARHLRLDGPGHVLVPGEDTDTLSDVDLATGEVTWSLPTGRRPHDAQAGADGTVLSANEKGRSVLFSRDGREIATVGGIIQPGGVAVSGGTGLAVDVRGDTVHLYSMSEHVETAVLDAGEGSTHAEALGEPLVAVADTEGDAVLVYDVGDDPRLLTTTAVDGGPYGLAYDAARSTLWVAGSGSNLAHAFTVGQDGSLTETATVPTVSGPYSLAVDPASGDLWVAGRAQGQVQRVPATAP